MKDRNALRCPKCGFGVYTGSPEKSCAKCDTRMIFICSESEYKKRAEKKLKENSKWEK